MFREEKGLTQVYTTRAAGDVAPWGGNVTVESPYTLGRERPGFKFRPCIYLLSDFGQVSRALCVLIGKMEKAIGLLQGAGADQ